MDRGLGLLMAAPQSTAIIMGNMNFCTWWWDGVLNYKPLVFTFVP